MANSTVLLLQPIENLGGEGDEVTVKAGYARNFLLPRKLALPLNRANTKYIDSLRARRAERERQERGFAEDLLARLEKLHFAIPVKTGQGGKMFGSVTANDLIERIKEEGIELDKKQINLYTPVKSLGKHTTKVKLHPEITYELEWEVVSENPIEDDETEGESTEAVAKTPEA